MEPWSKMLRTFVKQYKTDLLLLALILPFLLATNIDIHSHLKQVPASIYEGDYYYQQGSINHIRYGGSAAANSNLLSSTPGYFPLYGILVAATANVLNMETMDATFLFSNIAIVLGVLLLYVLLRKIFHDPYLAALGVMLFCIPQTILVKYAQFGKLVMTPVFILCLYSFYKKQSYANAICLGLGIGLANITHSIYLPVTYFTTGLCFLFILNKKSFSRLETRHIKSTLKRTLVFFGVVFAISFIISLFYWSDPILKHGRISPHYLEWNGPGDFSRWPLKKAMLRAIVTRLFFTFSSAYMFTSVLSMVGIVLVVTLKKHEEEHKFVILVLVSILLMALSYFVTVPLFKIHFVPDRIMGVFAVVPIMFSLFALSVLIKIPAAKYKGHANYLRVQLLALLLVFAYCHVQAVNAYKGGEWYKVGLGSLDDGKMQMQNCILGNADVNDVILTTKEIGFAVNALTGRKLVVARRSANDAFENMDIREMDAAVILYGNNIALKKELIKKYSIKYLYWEYYWVASEFQIDPQGQVVGLSDPLMSFYDVGMAKYLEENGVRYMVRNTYIDPFLRTTSLRSRYHPKFDLIIVSADNYTDVTHPWNPNLDPLLTEIWSYEPGSRKLAALYAVN